MSGEVVSSENILECLLSVDDVVSDMQEYLGEMAEAYPQRDFSGLQTTLSELQTQLGWAIDGESNGLDSEHSCEYCQCLDQEDVSFEQALEDAVQAVVTRYAGAKVIKRLHLEFASEELH